MYEVKLSNGNKLTGLKQNGSCFDTPETLTREFFDGGLREVEILQPKQEDGETIRPGKFYGMTLGYLGRHGEITTFTLNAPSEQEARLTKIQGDIEYLAMMQEVEL